MGRARNMHAAKASSADDAEEPQPALSVASVRPSPLPDGANRVTGTAPAANTNDAGRLDRLDIAGRMKMLREAFERHALPDNSKADGEDWRGHLSHLAQQAATHR